MNDYGAFLEAKRITAPTVGLDADVDMNSNLRDWQARCVRFAIKKGRSALFADTGLGKTFMQSEWARVVAQLTCRPVLIFAPLAVAAQTVREGVKFGISVNLCRSQSDVVNGVNVTNYDMLEHFDLSQFSGVVLDESSIIKDFTGATTKALTDQCAVVPYRLCCSATPSPNDHIELGTHAEFLGIMSRVEMLATYFVHDGGDTSKWRLKGHAEKDFWRFICSWAISISKPSDIGGDDTGYNLPPLEIAQHVVTVDQSINTDGMLFRSPDLSATGLHKEMRLTAEGRAAEVARLIRLEPDETWIVWCNTEYEAEALRAILPECVEIRGSHSREVKEARMIEFTDGGIDWLLSKSSICGYGMNWQHCARMAFMGLSYSYEAMYQSIRRCWRYGQKRPVVAHVVIAETEGAVLETIQRKQRDHEVLKDSMNTAMREVQLEGIGHERSVPTYEVIETDRWSLTHGDCVEVARMIPDNSLDYSIFSPPFASLYTYSDAEADMGNCKSHEEFFEHMGFIIRELYRALKPGRNLSFHCMNLPSSKERDGVIGLKDFRGQLIAAFQSAGFTFHSEVCIWKDPVTAMQRTKAIGLLYKQLRKDSCMSRQGIPDYLVTMRKDGINPNPVTKVDPKVTFDDRVKSMGLTVQEWQEYASPVWDATNFRDEVDLWRNYPAPVWMDINPSDTLQRESAREERDERHICPLQLEVIRRGIRLWTNAGDLVFSPYAGIGSEGYVALKDGRRFIGAELKRSYFEQAARNLKAAEVSQSQLFDGSGAEQ